MASDGLHWTLRQVLWTDSWTRSRACADADARMALRPPPRAPPFTDFDEEVEEMRNNFVVLASDGSPLPLPDDAAQMWTRDELSMWFASGGMIAPPDDPKLRAAAAKMRNVVKSAAEMEADARVKDAQRAARQAPYFSKLSETDIKKAEMYREMAFSTGHPARDVGDLFAPDDEHLKALNKNKYALPFEKHLLLWNADTSKGPRKVYHPDEGFTHGASAALRGFDMRFFWDSASLKVFGAVRFSLAASIGWRQDDDDSFRLEVVHGGCVEACLDELTAEVMKINIAPQNLTAEITFKLKMPTLINQTYKLEAEITDCSPPTCMVCAEHLQRARARTAKRASAHRAALSRCRQQVGITTDSLGSLHDRAATAALAAPLPGQGQDSHPQGRGRGRVHCEDGHVGSARSDGRQPRRGHRRSSGKGGGRALLSRPYLPPWRRRQWRWRLRRWRRRRRWWRQWRERFAGHCGGDGGGAAKAAEAPRHSAAERVLLRRRGATGRSIWMDGGEAQGFLREWWRVTRAEVHSCGMRKRGDS